MVILPNRRKAFRSTAEPPITGSTDDYYNYVTLLLHMNGENGATIFTDNSNASRTISVYGNAQTSTAQSKFNGSSGLFDGSVDLIYTTANEDLNFRTQSWTIEFWCRWNSISGYHTIFDYGYTASGGLVIQSGNGTGKWIVYTSGTVRVTETSTTPTIGVWYHYAFVQNGTTITIYRNGIAAGSGSSSISLGSTDFLGIGAKASNAAYGFNGNLAEYRLTKGIARYTADFTPPTDAFPEEQNPVIPATAYFPTTDLIWHIDAASGVRTTGGTLATNGQVVDSWDTQVGSANMSYITGTQGVYYSSGGPNNLPYVDTLGGQYNWTAQFAKTVIVMYKLASNAVNFPLQDATFDIGSFSSYWGEYRSYLSANRCQVYDRGAGGFWWWGDRPGGGGKTTWFTFAPTGQWMIIAMRINFGDTTNSIQIDSTRDRRLYNIFNGQICRAAAYSSILSNTDLAAIFQLWSIEAGIGVRNAVGNLSTILDRSEY